ncbi:MAG TPA: PAS domain S-box protein [Candidatus Paceibacterota bacterium]|nr:PAS domain S-box protein [Verrucomicrobiota bacterium]HSA12034.1 PAS domain S-box protein [Candidatus Paceibacterota bacterium]
MPRKSLISRNSWAVRYGAALVAVAICFGWHRTLEQWVGPGQSPFITFYPGVILVALLAGLGPGLLASVAAAGVVDFWILPPVGFKLGNTMEVISLGLFLGNLLLMCTVAELLRRARVKAAAFDRDQALRETRQQREFLAAVLERASQPFVVGYPGGRIGLVNRAYAELTGYTADELRAMDWTHTLTPPEWLEVERPKLEELHRTGQPVRYEKEYIRKDGRRVPVELLVHLSQAAGDKLEYYYTFVSDLTERKQAEQQLRSSAAQLQATNLTLQESRRAALNLMEDALEARRQAEEANAGLRKAAEQRRLALEAADLGTWDYQFQSGEVFWDERCREMWGMAQSDHVSYAAAVGRIHPEDRAAVDKAVQEALAGRDGGAYHIEFRVVWSDGSVHWVASHGRVYFEGEGAERQATRFIGANHEVTAEKQAQEALRESQARLAAFAAATFEGIVLSERGRILDCNEQFAEMIGRSVQELIGASIEDLVAPDDRQRVMANVRSRQESVIEHRMLRLDGSSITIEAHGRPSHPSRPELRHTAVRDITERKRAERRSELLAQAASRLLSTDSPQTIVENLCRNVMAFLDCQLFFNYLVAETAGASGKVRLHLNASAGIPGAEARKIEWLDYGSAVCGCAARDACRIVAQDVQHSPDPRTELVRAYGVQAYACHPLMAGGRVLGTLSFGTRTRARFSDEELSLMKAVTDLVAIAMERQRAQAELRKVNEELEQRVADRTAELRAASRYARSLIEASLDPLVTISPEGKITDVNEATELATGVARDLLVGSDFSSYFTEPANAEAGYRKVLAEGLVRDYPLTMRHLSGRTIDVLYNATVYLNEAGEVQGVFAAARDITDRKLAERRRDFTSGLLALFAQKTSARDYLNSVLEVVRQWTGCQALGIRIADEQGEIPFAAWAGFEPEFVERENRLSLKRDNCCCVRALSLAFEQPDRRLLTPGGSYRWDDTIAHHKSLTPEQQALYRGNCTKFGFASLAIIPIRYRDRAIGAIQLADRRPGQFPPAAIEFLETMTPLIGEAVHRFQTEAELARHRDELEVLVAQRTGELTNANARLQQTAEELQRSNRDLEQFAYVASHDLQEPLRAVGGYIKLVERRMAQHMDAKAREYITGAFEGALRMERLINDLLAFSRVGTRGGQFSPTQLDTVLLQALANLHDSIESAQAVVTRDPLPTLPVDGTQFMQVFQNLIGNAIKFRGDEPPKVHISAQPQNGGWLFSVRDNGIGIAPAYSERIFQLFQRLHTRKQYSGTGIGLAVCKRIVERHGGAIWVESQPGLGATFYFSLPATPG